MFPETWLGLLACAAAILLFIIFRHKLGGSTKEQNEEIAQYLESGHFYHVKGVELGEKGDHRGAEHYFRLELEHLRQTRPPGDADLHRARENLAVCLNRQNRPGEAETIYREQLAEQEETTGKTNPATHDTRLNLVRALRMQGKLGEAEALLGEQAAIHDRLFGQRGDEKNDEILLERAALHSALGEHDKAHEELESIIADKGRRLGDQHPETLRFKRIKAGELHLQGSNAEAETLFQDILRDQKRIEAEDDLFVTKQRLADFYLATGRAEETVLIHDELDRQLRDNLPADHPNIHRLSGSRAIALEAAGHPVRGEMLLRGALPVLEREYGPDHIDVISLRETLANILERRDRDAEAGEEFRLLVGSLERVYGEESVQA